MGRVRPTGQPPLLSYRLLGATPSSAVQRAGTRRSQGGGEGRHNTVSVVTGVGTQQHCSRRCVEISVEFAKLLSNYLASPDTRRCALEYLADFNSAGDQINSNLDSAN